MKCFYAFNWLPAACLCLLAAFLPDQAAAQTLVGPTNGGNFTAGTFALNNCTVVNGTAVNTWQVRVAPTGCTGNSAYFTRLFTKTFGQSPSSFRASLQTPSFRVNKGGFLTPEHIVQKKKV